MIRIEVRGAPVPQGSLRAVDTAAGPRVTANNAKRLNPWRADVTEAVRSEIADGWHDLGDNKAIAFPDGPVVVAALFRFRLGKSRRRTGKLSHVPRADVSPFVSGTPDRDKLARAIGDAITAAGCAWGDDAQDAIGASAKIYVPPGEWTGALILLGDATLEWFDVMKTFRWELQAAIDRFEDAKHVTRTA